MNFGIPVFASGVCVRMRVDVCPDVRVCVRVSEVLHFLFIFLFIYVFWCVTSLWHTFQPIIGHS